MDIVNIIIIEINNGIKYLKENLWQISVLLIIGFYIKDKVSKHLSSPGYRLTSTSTKTNKVQEQQRGNNNTKETTTSNTTTTRDEELLRIRLKQQEIANERAIEAAKELKKKQDLEKLRKNQCAKPRNTTQGNKLGRGGGSGYNPLQPWSSSGGGGGYKPTKRTVRRG